MPRSFQIDGQSALLQQDVDCIYCHADILLHEYVTICPTCHSPHHVECWKSNENRCATFGCDFAEVLANNAVLSRQASTVGSRLPTRDLGRQSRTQPTVDEWSIVVAAILMLSIPLFCLMSLFDSSVDSPVQTNSRVELTRQVAGVDPVEIATRVASYTPTPSSEKSDSPSAIPAIKSTPVANIRVGTTSYQITGIWSQGPQLEELDAQGEFVVINLSITNRGTLPVTYRNAYLIDSSTNRYSPIYEARKYVARDSVCDGIELLQGQKRSCMMVFDVKLETLEWLGLALSDLDEPFNIAETQIVRLPQELPNFRWTLDN